MLSILFRILYPALHYLINIISTMIVIRAVLSWFPSALNTWVGSLLVMLTEPVIAPARKLLSKIEFMRSLPADFSPMVAFLALLVLQNIITAIFSVLLTLSV